MIPTPHRRSRAHRDNRDTITELPTHLAGAVMPPSLPLPFLRVLALLARAALGRHAALLGRPY